MVEYIERQAAIDVAREDGKKIPTVAIRIMHDIKAIPAADVAPVVHGEWIRSGTEGHIVCNKCGYEAKYTIVERQDATGKWISRFAQDMKTNFCPNCGAKMDGEGKEQNYADADT